MRGQTHLGALCSKGSAPLRLPIVQLYPTAFVTVDLISKPVKQLQEGFTIRRYPSPPPIPPPIHGRGTKHVNRKNSYSSAISALR